MMAYDTNMSESYEVSLQRPTTSSLQISLPTGPRERWRVAGSHTGTVPVSVGELFKHMTLRARARSRRLMLAALLSLPATLGATEPQPVGTSTPKCSHTVTWYFQSGQWRADIRTVKAACEFLIEDDSGKTTPHRIAK